MDSLRLAAMDPGEDSSWQQTWRQGKRPIRQQLFRPIGLTSSPSGLTYSSRTDLPCSFALTVKSRLSKPTLPPARMMGAG